MRYINLRLTYLLTDRQTDTHTVATLYIEAREYRLSDSTKPCFASNIQQHIQCITCTTRTAADNPSACMDWHRHN